MKLPMSRRLYTLIFVRDRYNDRILLGLKKRGFGVNKFVGLGGKLEPEETLHECAIREAKEESGLTLNEVRHLGCVEFQFEDKMQEVLEVHVFVADSFEGDLVESDELKPQWFDINKIPYEKMWHDSVYWHSFMLADKLFKGYFLFKQDQETIVEYDVHQVESL